MFKATNAKIILINLCPVLLWVQKTKFVLKGYANVILKKTHEYEDRNLCHS